MSDQQLQDEWARMNASGRAANRKKALATLASIGVTLLVLAVCYPVLLFAWSGERIPVLFLALPWFVALPAGLFVQRKLAPKGFLGR
jgi:hypothetical protein